MITTIKELFNIEYGQREFHNKEWLEGNEGNSILISSKGEDNGIYGFFNIKTKYKIPIITIQNTGTIGYPFIQFKNCSVDDNCLVLIPKKKISEEELFQVAFQIRSVKWKFRYGRQITPDKIGKEKIKLIELKDKYKELKKNNYPRESKRRNIKVNNKVKFFKVSDICKIEKKSYLPQNKLEENENSKIPYVSTTSFNNGVKHFYDEIPNFKGKCLSVALNGDCGKTFFQNNPFITSTDNAVIELEGEYGKYFLFYLGALIREYSWRYFWTYKLTKVKLENMKVPLPIKNGKIDMEYIKNLVSNCYGFKELIGHY